jgi:hypothetical protein
MGRLSAYAKNRILKLRFKKNKRIIHIVEILKRDDNIKVSRQAVSTFLKKYLETNSIYDKPRTGRKRKLTPEEIQLIGQVTRLNRDITARAIKEYLNLNVSTYTILRATKLFEWNKVNPNSNDSKKQEKSDRAKEKAARKKAKKEPQDQDNSTSSANNNTSLNTTANDGGGGEKVGDLTTTSHMSESFNDDRDQSVMATSELNQDDEFDEEMDDGEVEKIQPRQLSKINAQLNGVQNYENQSEENINNSQNGEPDALDTSDGADTTKPKTRPYKSSFHTVPGNFCLLLVRFT